MPKPLMTKKAIAKLSFDEVIELVKIDATDVRDTLAVSTGKGAPVNNTVTLAQILEARPENEASKFRKIWGDIVG